LQSKQKKIMTTSWFLFDTVNSLTDTYDGLMNIQTNGIIKTLTILTAMMWLFTLITWFYGMNMSVPLGGHPLWYLIVIGWMVIFGGLMAAVFRKKWRI
jgi:magnesium transporter